MANKNIDELVEALYKLMMEPGITEFFAEERLQELYDR
jgi:hypothetical protein